MYDINLKKERLKIVSLFYRYFVLNYQKDQMKQEILAETQFVWANSVIESMLLDLSDQVVDLQSALEKYLKKEWSWERLPNLVKASLIEGVFEIKNTTIPKAITIDSITEIVKNLQPDWDYKFVNAILDNFQKD